MKVEDMFSRLVQVLSQIDEIEDRIKDKEHEMTEDQKQFCTNHIRVLKAEQKHLLRVINIELGRWVPLK
jgi:hypothetical protein